MPMPQRLPQLPQLWLSVAVVTHEEPQAVWPPEQFGVLEPPVPVAELPPVPGLPPVDGLLQATARVAKKNPKRQTRTVFITTRIPGQTRSDLPSGHVNAMGPPRTGGSRPHE
jgi:hypothetical protein